MNRTPNTTEVTVRLAGGLLMLASVAACHWVAYQHQSLTSGAALLAIGGSSLGLTGFARGLGARLGAGIGAVTGTSVAIALARLAGAGSISELAFMFVAAGSYLVLGLMSGSWRSWYSSARDQVPVDRRSGRSEEPPLHPDPRTSAVPPIVSAGLVCELSQFLQRDPGTRRAATAPTWSEFDQFVQDVLQRLHGAVGVKTFQVSDDDEHLLLLGGEVRATDLRSARSGLVGAVIASGLTYCQGSSSAPNFEAQAGENEKWAWVLPLRMRNRTHAVITVEQFTRPTMASVAHADAVREQMQLLWNCVAALQAVEFSERSEVAGGILRRQEFFTVMDRAVREAQLNGEPILILVLAIEGMRRLDDVGAWAERDLLLDQLAAELSARSGGELAIGRFSEDRFVLTLRRVGLQDAPMHCEVLVESVFSVLNSAVDRLAGLWVDRVATPDTFRAIRLRSAAVGREFSGIPDWRPFAAHLESDADGAAISLLGPAAHELLVRAFSLLEYARRQQLDFAIDTMAGIPQELRRPGAKVDESSFRAVPPAPLAPPLPAPPTPPIGGRK